MQLIYALEAISGPAIFLAGPTPRVIKGRSDTPQSWRPDAIRAMAALGYEGALLIPEDRNGGFHGDYLGQIDWETAALLQAICILFWVPRRMDGMPGLTTNDEWGFWKASGKVVFGAPPWAEKVRYQQLYCERHGIPCLASMERTCEAAIELFNRNKGFRRYEP